MTPVRIEQDDDDDGPALAIVHSDPLFFACEECRGPCRGHAFAEPLATIVAGMEIGLANRPEPTDEHDEVPLPLDDTSVKSFVDEFDAMVGWWGEWDPGKPEWNQAWFMRSTGAWGARIKRQREQRRVVIALLRVLLLHPRAWRDHGGWHGSLDNEWLRAKLRRCGVTNSDSILAAYVAKMRATGEIDPPSRNRSKRPRPTTLAARKGRL